MLFRARVRSIVLLPAGAATAVLVAACSSSSSGNGGGGVSLSGVEAFLEPDAGSCSSPGGPAQGPQDDHCYEPDGGAIVQPTTEAACSADAGPTGMGDDGGGSADGGGGDAGNIGNCGDPDYGPTMYGVHGGDDDCKYDLTWTSTPVCRNQPVYFTVIVTHRTDGSPLTGANPRPDVVLDCQYPVPNGPDGKPTARAQSPEVAPGTYIVGPIVFDKPGKWVFRFHVREECVDLSRESPHGHAAFYVDVP
jgi:hypothetical protein